MDWGQILKEEFMEIIKREKGEFGEIKIDFYLNKDRAILVTIEQLAQGFGYQSKRAVEKDRWNGVL